MVSTEIVFFRAKFCKQPVRNACGKKKPDIQKLLGMPASIQLFKNETRARKSITHAPETLYIDRVDIYSTLPAITSRSATNLSDK